jgi:hypothetical protein
MSWVGTSRVEMKRLKMGNPHFLGIANVHAIVQTLLQGCSQTEPSADVVCFSAGVEIRVWSKYCLSKLTSLITPSNSATLLSNLELSS